MDRDNKPSIKYSPELNESVTWLLKRNPLTPSVKRELKALKGKIARIVEKTKKKHPGKTGWEYLENILDKDRDLYTHMRNHIIKLLKQYGIELTIYDNSLYNETIGHEAEEIMMGMFEDEWRGSNIEDLEHIPLHAVNKIENELDKKKYKHKHLAIVSPVEDTEPGCISENDLGTAVTELEEIDMQEIMTILKEILTLEQYEIFDLHVIEQMKFKMIGNLKDIKESRAKQIYRTAKNKIKKDKRINF